MNGRPFACSGFQRNEVALGGVHSIDIWGPNCSVCDELYLLPMCRSALTYSRNWQPWNWESGPAYTRFRSPLARSRRNELAAHGNAPSNHASHHPPNRVHPPIFVTAYTNQDNQRYRRRRPVHWMSPTIVARCVRHVSPLFDRGQRISADL